MALARRIGGPLSSARARRIRPRDRLRQRRVSRRRLGAADRHAARPRAQVCRAVPEENWLVASLPHRPLPAVIAARSPVSRCCVVAGLFRALPRFTRLVLGACIFALMTRAFSGELPERLVPTLYVALVSIVLGGAITISARRRFAELLSRRARRARHRRAGRLRRARGSARSGSSAKAPTTSRRSTRRRRRRATSRAIDAPDPSAAGPFAVTELVYGSGKDRRRAEYGSGAQLITRAPLHGASFIHGWNGVEAWGRRKFWGIDATSMPINVHAGYPEGAGPFPILRSSRTAGTRCTISPRPGTAYLAPATSPRTASSSRRSTRIFLNAGPWLELGLGGLAGDNAARGYLLLEHLNAFRKWNGTPGNPFYAQGPISSASR